MSTPPQTFFFEGRVLAWFSCGAASAVAAKLACEKHGDRCIPVYCNTLSEEHPDNQRFISDVERWIGRKITIIGSGESPTQVFARTGYMSGPSGARCTTELKKLPRLAFANPEDVHVFGFTADEEKRIVDFQRRNPELFLEWVLRDKNITKQDCYQILSDAGIQLPAMYLMGYPHNNCIGCVKATSPGYWNKVRVDFPDLFKSRAEQSRRMGVRLARAGGERVFLDELDPSIVGNWKDEVISCGPDCGQVSNQSQTTNT